MNPTKAALLGAGFIADIHLDSYHRFVPEAEAVAVFTCNPGKAAAFAKHHGIAQAFSDLETAIAESDCEVVDVCQRNFLHHRAVLVAEWSSSD